MTRIFNPNNLAIGDHCIYGVTDVRDWLVSFRTYSPAVHIEIYVGELRSVASRTKMGVGLYEYRQKQLIGVLEPKQSLNIEKALDWFYTPYDPSDQQGVIGRPYGWKTLARFYNIRLNDQGWICSQFASFFDNAADFYPFAKEYYAGAIDPGDYFESPSFTWKWVDPKTEKELGKF